MNPTAPDNAEFSQFEQEAFEEPKTGRKGWGDIISGAILIGIGLFMGGSIFTGDATWIDYIFDVLGIFWVGRGIYRLITTS